MSTALAMCTDNGSSEPLSELCPHLYIVCELHTAAAVVGLLVSAQHQMLWVLQAPWRQHCLRSWLRRIQTPRPSRHLSTWQLSTDTRRMYGTEDRPAELKAHWAVQQYTAASACCQFQAIPCSH